MDPTLYAILLFLGAIFLVSVAILAFLMPFFVLRIRNEIVKLNFTVTTISDKIGKDRK